MRWQEQLNFHTPHFDCSLGSPWLAGRQAGLQARRRCWTAAGRRLQGPPLVLSIGLAKPPRARGCEISRRLGETSLRDDILRPTVPKGPSNHDGVSPSLDATAAAMRKKDARPPGGIGGALSSTLHWSALASSSQRPVTSPPYSSLHHEADSHVATRQVFFVCRSRVISSAQGSPKTGLVSPAQQQHLHWHSFFLTYEQA